MKILVFPNAMKGTFSSLEIQEIIKNDLLSLNKDFNVFTYPLADGGDGTLEAINYCLKRKIQYHLVTSLKRNKKKEASYVIDNKTAYFDVSSICGLRDVEGQNNIYEATTFGVGEMILYLLNLGVKKIVIGLGGVATNDLGVGMLQALGIRFISEFKITNILQYERISSIDCSNLNSLVKDCEFIILSDCNNPLLGKNGATYVYAPQKGALKDELKVIERNIQYLSDIYKKFNINYQPDKEGMGAAGGLGAAFSFLSDKTKIISGCDYILNLLNLKDEYDLVITSEGKIDRSSFSGKSLSILLSKFTNLLPIGGYIDEEGKIKLEQKGIKKYISLFSEPVCLKRDKMRKMTEERLKDKLTSFFEDS